MLEDEAAVADDCTCEFDWPEHDGELPWHYHRTCLVCTGVWGSLHCVHDGAQNGCPYCGWRDPGKRTPSQILGLPFDTP